MKLDLFEPYIIDSLQQQAFLSLARETCFQTTTHAAIITDFGLGFFSSRGMTDLCTQIRPTCQILAADVSGRKSNLSAMRHLDLLCPSESEVRDALGLQSEGLPLVTWKLLEQTSSRGAIITLNADGLIAFDRLPSTAEPDSTAWRTRLTCEHVPALCPMALDPLGCGDALLATAALALTTGAGTLVAGFLGAIAAAQHVQRLGNIPVSASDLRQTISRLHASHLMYAGEQVAQARTTLVHPSLRAG
jgi:bifunctional ADP-heptose synthase (sugar kinase/adenylyltransferase)